MSQKKRILYITYHLPMPSEPGACRPWVEARLMKQAGYDVTVITSGVHYMTGKNLRTGGGWCTDEDLDGIRVLRTWAPEDFRTSIARRMFNYMSYTILGGFAAVFKAGKAQRVFAGTDPIFIMPMVYLVSLIKRAPMILDERDLFPETAIATGVMKDGLITKTFFRMQQFFRRKSVRILSATPGIRETLKKYGYPEEKLSLLYNGDPFFHEDLEGIDAFTAERDLRKETGKKFLLGYAGGLGYTNDIPTLLRTAGRLQDVEDLAVVIIGTGENLDDYKKFCEDNDISNVHFTGGVPRRVARSLLSQTDVCVNILHKDPHFDHTLQSKIFDYHGLSKPVVFCGRGDAAKLLEQSGGGITVPSGDDAAMADAIRKLYADPELRNKMGESARVWFRENIAADASCSTIKNLMEAE